MINREEATKRFILLHGKSDNVVTAFEFNLLPTSETAPAEGIAGITDNAVIIYINGVLQNIFELDKAKEFKCVSGIGCVFMECIYEGEQRLVCRADQNYQKLFAEVSKRINWYIEKGRFIADYDKEVNTVCEKCHRPFPQGSDMCPRCIEKGKYIKKFLNVAKPYRKYIYLTLLLLFISSGIHLLLPYLNRILVDDYIKADIKPQLTQFIIITALIFAVNIFSMVIGSLHSVISSVAGNKVIVRLREMVFEKIQTMSLGRVHKRTTGELMNRVTQDTRTLQNCICYNISEIIYELILFLVIGTYLFVYDWKLALIILFPMPVVVIINRLIWNGLSSKYHKQWIMRSKLNSILHDTFSGIRVVKAFGMEKTENDRYDKTAAKLRDISYRNESLYSILTPVISFVMGLGEFFLLYYTGSKILGNEMTLGEMQQFSSYVSMIYGPLRWFSWVPRRIIEVLTSTVKIFEILDEKSDVADKENAREIEIEGHIDFENVSFGYDSSAEVLKNVDLHIEPGEMIGIVGKSGVGKSTLINLVMRLYDVGDGSLKIDGYDIRDISQESLRSQIGVVLQETFLFSGSIYDNIAYAKPDATRDEIIAVSKKSGVHQFVMRLPDAYNTKVGENGHTLSGGERQRVAIARALLRNPRILILDEATAALDTETEKQIQDALQKLIRSRTTIAIAHRLSTLRNATRLIVLDKGTVAESGTHEELMRRMGIYYGLIMQQRQMSKIASGK